MQMSANMKMTFILAPKALRREYISITAYVSICIWDGHDADAFSVAIPDSILVNFFSLPLLFHMTTELLLPRSVSLLLPRGSAPFTATIMPHLAEANLSLFQH